LCGCDKVAGTRVITTAVAGNENSVDVVGGEIVGEEEEIDNGGNNNDSPQTETSITSCSLILSRLSSLSSASLQKSLLLLPTTEGGGDATQLQTTPFALQPSKTVFEQLHDLLKRFSLEGESHR